MPILRQKMHESNLQLNSFTYIKIIYTYINLCMIIRRLAKRPSRRPTEKCLASW